MRENEERWKALCAEAAKEQSPTRLRELVHEINELLSQKQTHLDAEQDEQGQQDEPGKQGKQEPGTKRSS